MPTYEYACSACGHEWEQSQRITEPPVDVCPKCAANAAHRLISGGTNFILKGGGWYSDLYASPKAGAKKTEGAASESKTSESGESNSGESKTGTSSNDKGATKDTAPSTSSPTPPPSST